jgi:prepilin-type N-terminal cleavage/methylation domain-containing protein
MRLDKKGFTLIEIIIALVLAGLLAALAGPMLSGAMKGNATAVQNMEAAFTLQSQMEKIANCYVNGTMTIANLTSCVTNNTNASFSTVSAKTGYTVLSGSTFTVDNTQTSSKLYTVTLKSAATGETLAMLFSEK